MIFCQSWGKPGYGKNAGLVQGLTTGPHHIQLTGSYFLSVPGPIAAQIERRATLDLVDKPQGAGRHHDQTERMSADDALPLTALILPQSSEGVSVANGHFHRPAVAILVQDIFSAQRQIGGEEGFENWGWFSLPRPFGRGCALTSQHHDPHEASRQHRVPQALPGLDLSARFAGVGRPLRGSLGEGLGRADQGAFFARGAATLGGWWGRHLVELGADGEAPHDMGRLGQLPDIVLGGIAPVRQAPDGPAGRLRGYAIEDSTGQLTSGLLRHVEGGGLGGFAVECEPDPGR
jgi:hypothetical protein